MDGFKLDSENMVCVAVEPETCGPFEDVYNNCECVENAAKIESDDQSACKCIEGFIPDSELNQCNACPTGQVVSLSGE